MTRRERKRRAHDGSVQVHTRFVLNFRDPASGARRQLFFERRNEAMAARDALITAVMSGQHATATSAVTVKSAVDHWLENRRGHVKASTWDSYKRGVGYVTGPLIVGSAQERRAWARGQRQGAAPRMLAMLGEIRIADLTTAHIRSWHNTLIAEVGSHTAHAAKKFLRAVLALAAEDFQLRVPPMPMQLARSAHRERKRILTPHDVRRLLQQAEGEMHGLYYAFPFLTGVRPSEQLGLLWQDVDLERRLIHIRRMQELDGRLTNLPKTEAGERLIPISCVLHHMLVRWQQHYPSEQLPAARVFVGLGRTYAAGFQPLGVGRPLTYANFRNNYWKPAFARAQLAYVTPHSARHTFISVLQAAGVELGLVSKLAGHANPSVTLQHYTQAVRGGEDAIARLETIYARGGDERLISAAPV
ncbi:MAG: tyrosine-type recombinase/integrase [Hyphomicrobiaceae bacterium]|nr:tyrosine-type recombinase/integrase [Hyphomicrobiaceae bacterium]